MTKPPETLTLTHQMSNGEIRETTFIPSILYFSTTFGWTLRGHSPYSEKEIIIPFSTILAVDDSLLAPVLELARTLAEKKGTTHD